MTRIYATTSHHTNHAGGEHCGQQQQQCGQGPRSTPPVASSSEPHLLDTPNPDSEMPTPPPLPACSNLPLRIPRPNPSAMFVATELLDRRLQATEILALMQGTIHDQREAHRILAALKAEAAREQTLNDVELQLSPAVASEAVDPTGTVDLPSLATPSTLHSVFSSLPCIHPPGCRMDSHRRQCSSRPRPHPSSRVVFRGGYHQRRHLAPPAAPSCSPAAVLSVNRFRSCAASF